MRAENAYFVDRTGLIRELEKTSYAMFLRPGSASRFATAAMLRFVKNSLNNRSEEKGSVAS